MLSCRGETMTTRTAELNGHRCPHCGGQVKHDLKRRGFVAHKYRPSADRAAGDGLCPFERKRKML
jgi:hypothetical protein